MSKGQETILCRSRDGTALGDISQQLGRGFHRIPPQRVSHQGEKEQRLGVSFNPSISQGEFKDQSSSLLVPAISSHLLYRSGGF